MGANVFKDIGATFRNITGGRAEGYEKELRNGRDMALQEMADAATELGSLGSRLWHTWSRMPGSQDWSDRRS